MVDNKRIMRNTLFLALRMPIVFVVGLFMSRVVLQELGTVDFGIYQVVAGFVLMIAFVNSALTTSIQRFMSVELVRPGGDMQTVFGAACKCILIVCLIFLFFAETAGLWLWTSILDIPEAKLHSAMIVYQLALVTTVIEFFRVPYFSMLVAHEKMQFYTYHTLGDSALKLVVSFSLFLVHGDKLTAYAAMLVGVAVLLNVILVVYCRMQFPHVRFSFRAPFARVKEITGFVGWTSLNSLSFIFSQQGGNMILNIFYGVTLNATMGIVNQVKNGITTLSRNLLLASSPPMIKAFNGGEYSEFEKLFTRITRIVFYIILFFGLPVMLNANFILEVWLVNIPPEAALFLQWMVVYCLVDALTGPMETAMYACGRLGAYQVSLFICWAMYLVLLYLVYHFGAGASWIVKMQIAVNVVVVITRFWFVHRYCEVPLLRYLKDAILPLLCVAILGSIVPVATCFFTEGLTRFLVSGTASVLSVGAAIYFVGLKSGERAKVRAKLKKLK